MDFTPARGRQRQATGGRFGRPVSAQTEETPRLFTPIVAKCRRGCRVRLNIETDSAGMVPVQYRRWSDEQAAYVPYCQDTDASEAIPYLVWCLAHHEPLRGKAIRAVRGEERCSDTCRQAAGTICRCECGGENHGMDV